MIGIRGQPSGITLLLPKQGFLMRGLYDRKRDTPANHSFSLPSLKTNLSLYPRWKELFPNTELILPLQQSTLDHVISLVFQVKTTISIKYLTIPHMMKMERIHLQSVTRAYPPNMKCHRMHSMVLDPSCTLRLYTTLF